MTPYFKQEGDLILLLGETRGHLGGSEYLRTVHSLTAGDAPEINLSREKALQECCLEMILGGLISSAHDLSEGGLAVTLAECCILNGEHDKRFGADVKMQFSGAPAGILFGEDQSRILVSLPANHLDRAKALCTRFNVPVEMIGVVAPEVLS